MCGRVRAFRAHSDGNFPVLVMNALDEQSGCHVERTNGGSDDSRTSCPGVEHYAPEGPRECSQCVRHATGGTQTTQKAAEVIDILSLPGTVVDE